MTVTARDILTLTTEVNENICWSEEENQDDSAPGPSIDSVSPGIMPVRNVYNVVNSELLLSLSTTILFYNICNNLFRTFYLVNDHGQSLQNLKKSACEKTTKVQLIVQIWTS